MCSSIIWAPTIAASHYVSRGLDMSVLQVLVHDTNDEVELEWAEGKVNEVTPWALVVGHSLNNQPVMMALGYTDGELPRLGHYTNGTACAEYLFGSEHIRCGQTWKIATLKPGKDTLNIVRISPLCMTSTTLYVILLA